MVQLTMFSRSRRLLTHSKRCYSTFESLGISAPTCQKLKANFNVTRPTLAQEQFIPPLLEGKRDILIRDNTGTGKSFGIAVTLASLIPTGLTAHKSVHSIYIAPNQELALQIAHWIKQLTFTQNFKICAGGLIEEEAEEDHSTLPHTVIGTPGRILDLLNEGKLSTHALDRLIVDEADQAFALPKRYAPIKQQNKRAKHPKPAQLLLEKLLDNTGMKKHQTVIASATLNRPLRYFVTSQNGWIEPNYLFVDITKGTTVNKQMPVQHHCLLISNDAIRNIQTEVKQEEKAPMVDFDDTDERMIDSIATLQEVEPVRNGILFVDPTTSVDKVKEKLAAYNVKAMDIKDYTHQTQQQQSADPRDSKTLWIATEFTARGIDLPNVSHVFILGKPSSPASYLHMAGRTGRLGPEGFRTGKVISLVRENGWTEAKMANMYKLLDIPLQQYEHVQ